MGGCGAGSKASQEASKLLLYQSVVVKRKSVNGPIQFTTEIHGSPSDRSTHEPRSPSTHSEIGKGLIRQFFYSVITLLSLPARGERTQGTKSGRFIRSASAHVIYKLSYVTSGRGLGASRALEVWVKYRFGLNMELG